MDQKPPNSSSRITQLVAPPDTFAPASGAAPLDALVSEASATVALAPTIPGHAAATTPTPTREFLWKVHGYTNDYIRFADTKSGFTVALSTAVTGALFGGHLHKLFIDAAPIQWGALAWLSLFAFFFLIVSILCAVAAVRPRLWVHHSKKGVIFWGSIAEFESADAFADSFRQQGDGSLSDHVAHHVYALAKICQRKYHYVNIAIVAGVFGGLLGGIVMLLKPPTV